MIITVVSSTEPRDVDKAASSLQAANSFGFSISTPQRLCTMSTAS